MSVEGLDHRAFEHVDSAVEVARVRTAVVCPVDDLALGGALQAARHGLIDPMLIGPEKDIKHTADVAELDLGDAQIIDVADAHEAAEKAATLAGEGAAQAIMKGRIHTDELMAAIVAKKANLRTDRRMTHVFSLDVPRYHKALHITDAALNIAPDVKTKTHIALNAIDLLHALGVAEPKIAVMSATETASTSIPSSMDAAAMSEAAREGSFPGALVDGPFAFDNAISEEAARRKKISSPVAGDADVLLVPTIEAGNMLAKQLVYLAESAIAGIVLGARVPVILTSRADNIAARLASCRLAQLVAAHNG